MLDNYTIASFAGITSEPEIYYVQTVYFRDHSNCYLLRYSDTRYNNKRCCTKC